MASMRSPRLSCKGPATAPRRRTSPERLVPATSSSRDRGPAAVSLLHPVGQLRAHEPASTDDIGRVPAKQSGLFGKLGGIACADNRYLLPVVVGQSAVGTRAAPILAETAAV